MTNNGPVETDPIQQLVCMTAYGETVHPTISQSDPSNEASLIAGILAGDTTAFATLVQPHLHLFTTVIHRILQDDRDTQEALQESLLSMHAELHRFSGDCKFTAWAYRLCLNEALMLRRTRMHGKGNQIQAIMPSYAE